MTSPMFRTAATAAAFCLLTAVTASSQTLQMEPLTMQGVDTVTTRLILDESRSRDGVNVYATDQGRRVREVTTVQGSWFGNRPQVMKDVSETRPGNVLMLVKPDGTLEITSILEDETYRGLHYVIHEGILTVDKAQMAAAVPEQVRKVPMPPVPGSLDKEITVRTAVDTDLTCDLTKPPYAVCLISTRAFSSVE